MNPLLLELYCRFRCHGSEKLGSVGTQNTFTTASIDGTTFTTCSHRTGSIAAGTSTIFPASSHRDGSAASAPPLGAPLGPPRRGGGEGEGEWAAAASEGGSLRTRRDLRPRRRGAGEDDAGSGSGESNTAALARGEDGAGW